jgi:DNA-binding response OmpR family regulator
LTQSIQHPHTRIILIEANSARRQMLSSGLKSLGYEQILPLPNVKAAFDSLASEPRPPDWIISPLMIDQPVNGLHLLNLTLTIPQFHGTRISFICEERGVWWLHHAFEMGLLSAHPFLPDTISQLAEVTNLFRSLDMHKGNETLVAADYLRAHLQQRKMVTDQVHLARSLVQIFPTNARVAAQFAEALHLDNKSEAAAVLLDRIVTDGDSALEKHVDELRTQIERHLNGGKKSHAFAQELGVETAVVVDPDEAMANYCRDLLVEMGVRKVFVFADGEVAWEHIAKSNEPDIVIQEWRIPGLPGNVLMQRIRGKGFHRCSIVIFSALVKQSDRLILRELGASDVITKPMMVKQLARVINSVITEDRKPNILGALERNTRKFIAARDWPAASQTLEKIKSQTASETSAGTIRALEAELAYAGGQWQKANQLAVEALQILGEDILVINLLGKIYMKLRNFDQAIKFFEKADTLSPRNIERLCDLALTEAERGNTKKAEEKLATTEKIDPSSSMIEETRAKVALTGGSQEEATRLLERLGDPSGVIAFLNNRGVALAMEGKFKEAVNLYRRALKALPKKLPHLAPMIAYNLGLAHARAGSLDEALWHLAEAAKVKDSPVRNKAADLLSRVDAAAKNNEPLVLKVVDGEDKIEDKPETITTDSHRLPLAPLAKPGQLRCHLVFQSMGAIDARFMNLLSGMPTFRARAVTFTKNPKVKNQPDPLIPNPKDD